MTSRSDPAPFDVHKFGGTSLAEAERYRAAADIVLALDGPRAVVVSAMAGVTDALIELTQLARLRDEGYRERLHALIGRVRALVGELLDGEAREGLEHVLATDARDLGDVLRAVWLGRSCAESTLELCSGYGELWSARTLCAHLRANGVAAEWIDAREVLIVRHSDAGPVVDWARSRERLDAVRADRPSEVYVVTGFVASTADGVPTTLKRNGSDYSASIFGALLDARQITIWTDVDGVLSADPRRVPEAEVLDGLSYDEAVELAYFGAKVIHPNTMAPAIGRGIPILIRNARRPDLPGTRIGPPTGEVVPRVVRGLSTVDGVALVNVEGTGMMGVPGVSRRLFGALESVGVSVVLISQASSEHSICFAVPGVQAERAVETVRQEFFAEMHHGHIQTVEVIEGCSILAAVGDRMAHTPGVAARFFGSLASAGVNVRAIAQGSSERNISAVVDATHSTRALRAVHSGFYLSRQTLSVGLIGPGQIGGTLLAQIRSQAKVLRERSQIELRVRGIATSKRMLLDPVAIDLTNWRDELVAEGQPLDLDRFAEHVKAEHLPLTVIVDCSASDAVADRYAGWLADGLHVVTPNKRAGSGPMERWAAIRAAGAAHGTRFLFEATVGAGLPVLSTLADLIATGDEPRAVDGVLSGTLGYLFHRFDGDIGFSALVREAMERGYTEPDPRDDLSGMDVARKLVILARAMGRDLELGDVEVESLVPAELADPELDVATFLERYAEADDAIAERVAKAHAKQRRLCYVGSLELGGRAAVGLREVDADHPAARARGSDNVIAFRTARYDPEPLIVQGPGAGPAVTAGGVFADLLRLGAIAGGTP